MTTPEILQALKTDLEIAVSTRDRFLINLIEAATAAVTNEGMTPNGSIEDGMIIEQYAAFLFRKRREVAVAMPRSLRWQLNNRILRKKAVPDGD